MQIHNSQINLGVIIILDYSIIYYGDLTAQLFFTRQISQLQYFRYGVKSSEIINYQLQGLV